MSEFCLCALLWLVRCACLCVTQSPPACLSLIHPPYLSNNKNRYAYHASIADAVGLALGRGLLTALVGAAILCLHHSARGGEGAGRGAKAAAWLAVLVNVGTVAFLVRM